jgi:tetratricopeptide (TPR) repeat protein
MTLRTSLLRQLENPNLSVDSRAELRCDSAREFEDKGEYEDAREVLGELWTRIGEQPKVEGLQSSMSAEVLMRVGVLTGIIGSKNQITDAQETAKNLISQSLTIFESLSYKKKIVEAHTELALCYWRTGEYNEARDLLRDILKRLTTDSELRAKAVLRLGIVERAATNYAESLRVLMEDAVLFQKINNQTLKGSYHVTLGNVLENLWESEQTHNYLDRALIEYAASSYHFEKAGHRCYRANVENNLGFLYFKINRCKKAHEHLDKARRILTSLKENVTIAQVDETRARVFLKQKRNVEAEKVARLSVRVLEESDRQSLLAEALITYGRASGRLGRYSVALSAFRRAIDISQHIGSLNSAREAALTAFQEIGEHLTSDEGQSLPAGRKFADEIRRFEHDLIKHALDASQGSITQAAKGLGISYQSLGYMLETRHKDLSKARTPQKDAKASDNFSFPAIIT